VCDICTATFAARVLTRIDVMTMLQAPSRCSGEPRGDRPRDVHVGQMRACAVLLAIVAVVLSGPASVRTAASSPDPSAPDRLRVDAAARAFQPGELIVFTAHVTGGAPVGVRVRAFGRDTIASPREDGVWTALVGIDLDATPGAMTATVTADTEGGALVAEHAITVLPKRFPTRRLKVAPAMVQPPAGALPRIRRERARLAEVYSTPAPRALWSGRFVRPVPHRVNSRFGSRSILNGRPSSPHAGADFLSPAGTPVKAPNAGTVRIADHLYFAGNTVIVDHGLGLFSIFAHLSEVRVREGDPVAAGEVVGVVGATGRVTGPHLHWAVRVNGARVDPMSILDVLGD
jgi:murein DD-endopeptidase MepM/ murein hydrolase activator NlpD